MSFDQLHRPRHASDARHPALASPARLFVVSFAGMILAGALGFRLLPGVYVGPGLGWVDSVFMATSAVCVTGLSVLDPGTGLTVLGQVWLALLIQLGGLGILTLTTLAVARIGRVPLSMEEAGGGGPVPLRFVDERALLRTILAVTLGVEAVGAAFLWWDWRGTLGSAGAAWPALFHAVSAFCNAGFSLFSDSLVGWRSSPLTLGVVMALIVAGGLGFVVMEDLRARVRGRAPRLSVHSRLVLAATAILVVVGWVHFLAFEWTHELAGMSLPDKLTNALFMSVTARTAGFNTVDYAHVSNPSLFFTILLMLVGGSPGSTAGGFKTTTVATLLLAFWARIRGEDNVNAFQRSLPRETVGRAAGLMVGGLIFLGPMVLLLMVTEAPVAGYRDRVHFLDVVFEAHSAFGTVGLSTGVTASMTPAGRVVLSVLMFVGRVGPAALVAAMISAHGRRRVPYRLGREDVMIG